MKILIKGAGDLATGIAYRLKKAGHSILMTECAIPTTVRRTVAFSKAVYEGEAIVEDEKAVLVNLDDNSIPNNGIKNGENNNSLDKCIVNDKLDLSNSNEKCEDNNSISLINRITKIQEAGNIALIVDEECKILDYYKPDILIDAIIAKKNLGTKITDAPCVLGIGPGFVAGSDCHAIIETKRGHTLGRVINKGSAIKNTGIPGVIGGFSIERLIRAGADGIFYHVAEIGDIVKAGDIVAYVIDNNNIRNDILANIDGIVRGMLQDNVQVKKGMKSGDIDPRAEYDNCFTISDKALSVGGGALEEVTRFEKRKENMALVLLAAGKSTRFGSNKLLELINNKPMIEYVLEKYSRFDFISKIIVTNNPEIEEIARKFDFKIIKNPQPDLGISHSIKLGINEVKNHKKCASSILFSVCDQPLLEENSIESLVNSYSVSTKGIACIGFEGETYNPNIFSSKYFNDLLELEGDKGGKKVILKNMEDALIVQVKSKSEVTDIDCKEGMVGLCIK